MTGEQMRKIRLQHGITFKDLRLDECPETHRIDETLYSKIEHGYADPTPEPQNRFLSVAASLVDEIPAGTDGTRERAVATRVTDIPRQTRRESYEAMDLSLIHIFYGEHLPACRENICAFSGKSKIRRQPNRHIAIYKNLFLSALSGIAACTKPETALTSHGRQEYG